MNYNGHHNAFQSISKEFDTLIEQGASREDVLMQAYKKLDKIASLKRREISQLILQLKKVQITSRDIDDWKASLKEVQAEVKQAALEERNEPKTSDTRPRITARDRDLLEVSRKTLQALEQYNKQAPELFVFGGALARVIDGSIEVLDQYSLKGLMAKAARYEYLDKKIGVMLPENHPPTHVAMDILTQGSFRGYPFPEILGVTKIPVVAPSGKLEDKPGYLPDSKLFYQADDLELGDTTPTKEAVEIAKQFIFDELLIDFPFVDEASKCHSLALFLLPFIRPYLGASSTPFHVIDAPSQETGKSLLSDVLTIPACAEGTASMNAVKTDEEWRKQLTTYLGEGDSHLRIDNITGYMKSAVLANAITTPTWKDRLLSTNRTIKVPVRMVWIGTANNVEMDRDLTTRSIWIRMDANMERPSDRTGFKHEFLEDWAKAHRNELATAGLILIRAWLEAGRPRRQVKSRFRKWGTVMAGIMDVIDVPGFLENAGKLQHKDPESAAWAELVEEWWQMFGVRNVKSSDLMVLASHYDNANAPLGQDILAEYLGAGNEHSRNTRLGKALKKRIDSTIGGYKIISPRVSTYKLEPI